MMDRYEEKPIQALNPQAMELLQKSSSYVQQSGDDAMTFLFKKAQGTAKKGAAPRMAFTENPHQYDHYAGLYKIKRRLLPDEVIKRIKNQDHLIAAILRARGNTMFMFGKERQDRMDVGLEVDIKPEFDREIEPEQMDRIQSRLDRFKKLLTNCGSNEGLKERDKMSLATFLDVSAQNGLAFGRFSTEFVYEGDGKLHRFRPIDAGTIYRSVKKGETADPIRRASIFLLENQSGEKIDQKDIGKIRDNKYDYIQVIDGIPRQAFTEDEMVVYNLFTSTDVEHNGYPITPLDTCITAVTTHICIEAYNELYFQNGRAAKGMLVIKSDDIDQAVIDNIKQQYMATINNVANSFHVPIFGVGTEDEVTFIPTMPAKKDGEFEFLYDSVARNILASFNISPDELPGYGHLSRGTNQQGLSESSNEYKLTAARDTGLRPLISKMEDFLNDKVFPKLDPELSQLCVIRLKGLDAESREQESVRLAQDTPLHYTYDEVLDEVDKDGVGEHLAGAIPFNERWHMNADKYTYAGEVAADLMDDPGALVDPYLRYKRDPFFYQHLQLMSQANPDLLKAFYRVADDDFDTMLQLIELELED
jgi:hypothetical protein